MSVSNGNVPEYQAILDFWFEDARESSEAFAARRAVWFAASDEFDEQIKSQFSHTIQLAADGQLSCWAESPQSMLALILVFDQYSCNVFRGTAQAFQNDTLALQLTERAVAEGIDQH